MEQNHSNRGTRQPLVFMTYILHCLEITIWKYINGGIPRFTFAHCKLFSMFCLWIPWELHSHPFRTRFSKNPRGGGATALFATNVGNQNVLFIKMFQPDALEDSNWKESATSADLCLFLLIVYRVVENKGLEGGETPYFWNPVAAAFGGLK